MLIWAWCFHDLLVSLLIDWILWSFDQNRSNPKVILYGSKQSILISKKHKRILSRKVHFWTEIWSDRGDGLRVGSEVWDESNTSSRRKQRRCPKFSLLAYISLLRLMILCFRIVGYTFVISKYQWQYWWV